MSSVIYDVVGIGNAIVDILIPIDNYFLDKQNLVKGGMSLIDLDHADVLLEKALKHLYSLKVSPLQRCGGSAANTLAGIASLEGKGAYLGRVSQDPFGILFKEDMNLLGIKTSLLNQQDPHQTGRCLVFITPDTQRTMLTYTKSQK